VSLDIANMQCFGCHSRSGRISISYEGWHEQHALPQGTADPAPLSPSRFRILEDERVLERVIPDIHQERGLDCIDCHTSNEAMGDGVAHARKSGQLKVACEDCHVAPGARMPTAPASQLDPESRKLLSVRNWPVLNAAERARARSGEILVNVVRGAIGAPFLVRKRTGERRELKTAAAACVEGRGHARLSCASCHTSWAPRCPTCHTRFDSDAEAYDWLDDALVLGEWKEEGGPFAAVAPTLGVRRVAPAAGREGREVVETFAPGMVLTIEGPKSQGQEDVQFRRLYARVEPHTTRRQSRSCMSCHNDPVALGYGQGELRYDVTATGGRWRFKPAMPALPQDGLPADAWVSFLGERSGTVSTRDDSRPFTIEEQRRILRVGACLTCHAGDSSVMSNSVRDFGALLARRSRRCVLPVW